MSELLIHGWTAERIAAAVGGKHIGGNPSVNSVSTDTRTISEGSLFVPLVGERFDGHDYIDQARESGASLVLSSRPIDGAYVEVEDTLQALQRLGHALWKNAADGGMRTIALTGSNGKTTTKELTAAVLRACGRRVHATAGNLNNHIGVPLTLCAMPQTADVSVVEMGCNQFGDISELIAFAPAEVRVVTSIGAAHLEVLGDLDGVRRAKSEIFEGATADTIALVPQSEREQLGLDEFPGRVFTVGPESSADFRVSVTDRSRGTQRVRVESEGCSIDFTLHLPGEHNARNAAMAWATALVSGFESTPEDLQAELDALVLPGGRFRQVEHGAWRFVDDAYNANPSSVRASYQSFLELLDEMESTQTYAVLGEMLELGSSARSMHEEVARDVAASGGVDVFVFVGPYADAMAAAVTAAKGTNVEIVSATDVVDAARSIRKTGPGLVFLKASRGARLERIIDMLVSKPWDT